jgi:biotin carboxyl carrier protein
VSKYQMTINGKDYEVEIADARATPVIVTVNGQTFSVILSQSGATAAPVRQTTSEAAQVDLDEVYVPNVATTFVETQVEEEPALESGPTPTGDLQQVTAPMPGKILDIAVEAGTTMSHGDTLCNLEAMKMKSPIRAPADGQIVQVLISEGQNVNFGDVLFTYQ